MGYYERKSVVNIIGTFVAAGSFGAYLLGRYRIEGESFLSDNRAWAISFLVFIGVSILWHTLVEIFFVIANKIIAQDEVPSVRDERDRLIERSTFYVSNWFFIAGVILGLATQALGASIWLMYASPFLGGFVSDVLNSVLTFRRYRRGY
jgi:hypothetical protein